MTLVDASKFAKLHNNEEGCPQTWKYQVLPKRCMILDDKYLFPVTHVRRLSLRDVRIRNPYLSIRRDILEIYANKKSDLSDNVLDSVVRRVKEIQTLPAIHNQLFHWLSTLGMEFQLDRDRCVAAVEKSKHLLRRKLSAQVSTGYKVHTLEGIGIDQVLHEIVLTVMYPTFEKPTYSTVSVECIGSLLVITLLIRGTYHEIILE